MRLAIVLVLAFAHAAVAAPERLEITAKVLEIPPPVMHCGVIAVREVVRFEVLSVSKFDGASPQFQAKEIFVVMLCPETLKVGQKATLILEHPTKSDDSYVDKFPKTAPRWVQRYR